MGDVATLRRQLEQLQDQRASGVRSGRNRQGEEEREIVFGSDRELAAAIADLERRIATAERGRPASTIRFATSKGL